jgi:hypothetical protein
MKILCKVIIMLPAKKKLALILLMCLTATMLIILPVAATGLTTTCTPSTQSPVAPGETIDLRGPDVTADQQTLGITWDYLWTIKENDASGATVVQYSTQAISFVVPTTGYKPNYYFDLMVTAHQAQLCINEACMKFPVVAPGQCSITTDAPNEVCVTDTTSYHYSTAATPSNVVQRWWIFPEAGLPSPITTLTYNGNSQNKVGDGNSITVNWHTASGGQSGVYVVVTAYFSPKTKVYQGSCQKQVFVVAVPSSTISVQ